MEERIKPALQIEEGQSLSSEEFQKLLYEYFEDKGVLSDLRAHLRSQMVQVLSDTSLGKTLLNKKKDISPKVQALNLLIAEHLLHKKYHYTLSVFSAEVPLNNTFESLCNDSFTKEFQFNDSDMWDILETLGFFKNSENSLLIVSDYKNESSESLLNCLIRYSNVLKSQEKKVEILGKEIDINLEKLINHLTQERIDPKIILFIVDQLKYVITNEVHQIKINKDKEVENLKEKLESESTKKLERYKKKLTSMEEAFERERKQLEVEIDEAKCNLKECAETLQIKYDNVSKQEASLERRAEELTILEMRLSEKENELQKQREELIEDTNQYTSLRKKIQEAEKNNLDNTVDKSTQATDKEKVENVILKQSIQQLQTEINRLRTQNGAYLLRLQELALRSNSFIQELDDRYPGVDNFNPFNVEVRPPRFPHYTPAIPPTNHITSFGLNILSNGGGEIGSRAPVIRPPFFRHLNTKDNRKRLQKKQQVQSPSSDDFSPTETILTEAKIRLENLERESTLIDKQFIRHLKQPGEKDYSSEGSTTSIIKEFQINLASIKENLSKVFQRKSKDINQPGTSKQSDVDYIPEDFDNQKYLHKKSSLYREINYLSQNGTSLSENSPNKNTNSAFKIQNLIAELPENYFNNVYNLEVGEENKENQSCNSSGIVVGTSISTVYVSPDEKSDTESKVSDINKL